MKRGFLDFDGQTPGKGATVARSRSVELRGRPSQGKPFAKALTRCGPWLELRILVCLVLAPAPPAPPENGGFPFKALPEKSTEKGFPQKRQPFGQVPLTFCEPSIPCQHSSFLQ